VAKLTKEQMAAIKTKERRRELAVLGVSENFRDRDVLDIKTNKDNSLETFPKKDFKLWVVEHPEGSDKVKGSETVVRSQHYGQAVDDFIIDWNKKKRLGKTIGYPVVQGEKV
jgi:hypothetical protein